MKLLKKLIPASTLLVATATSLVATSCSKSDDVWMYDITSGMTPSIKPLNIGDNLTLDQQYDKYVEEVKNNPKIWQEDCVYTLANAAVKVSNEENKKIDTTVYTKFGVSEPKIGTANYVNNDGSFTKKPTFTFKVKLIFNASNEFGDTKLVQHGEVTIEYKNVMMFPFVVPGSDTFGLSLTGNSYEEINKSEPIELIHNLFRINRNSANWSISINNDFTNYALNGLNNPTQTQEIHEHDIELNSSSDIIEWFFSHSNPEGGEELPTYMQIVGTLLFNFNYSYHMSQVSLAPQLEYCPNAVIGVDKESKENIIFYNLLSWDTTPYVRFHISNVSLTNDLVLKEVSGDRTITFPAASQFELNDGSGVCNLNGGVVDKEYTEIPEETPIYKFEGNEVKIKMNYTKEGDDRLYSSFQTIVVPTSFALAIVD